MMALPLPAYVAAALLSAGLAAGGLATQAPTQTAPPEQPSKNLKVLPKATSAKEVQQQMEHMRKSLGVDCNFCHEQDPDTKRIDYASDDNPVKETARSMMRMTTDINTKYLGVLGSGPHAPSISCVTCHQGRPHPPEQNQEEVHS